MTRVREAIAVGAMEFCGHFTVEQLAAKLAARGHREAHVATVYRNIPLMIEAGILAPALVSKDDGQHYEVVFEQGHHDHLVCLSCGAIVEVHCEALENLQREIAQRHGYELDAHVHELRGTCRNCRGR